MITTQERMRNLLGCLVSAVTAMERQCPAAVRKPGGAVSRKVPDDTVQLLRRLADQSAEVLTTLRVEEAAS